MLTHSHSGLRWVAIALLIVAIINSITNKNSYTKKDKMICLFAMITLHIQLLIGAILYYTSGKINFSSGWMKQELYRFFGMEHLVGMIIAIVLITMGYSKSKKTSDVAKKNKTIFFYYTLGLIIILLFIPWPFRISLGGGWF